MVAVRQRGVGGASGAATEFRYFHVWSFRGDGVVRLETFREREEARRAAGHSDSAQATTSWRQSAKSDSA